MPEPTNQDMTPEEKIAAGNAEADEGVAKAAEGAISKLIDQINAGTMKLQELNAAPRPAVAPVAAARPPLTPERLTEIAKEKGVGEALKEFTAEVIVPNMVQNLQTQAASVVREMERDAQLGPVFKKNKAAIEAYKQAHNIGDPYVIQYGLEDILKAVDPAGYVEATKTTPAPVKEKTALGTGAGEPRGEGVQRGPVVPPTGGQSKSIDDAIAAVEVSDGELAPLATYFGMDRRDVQKQKFERADWEKRLAPVGGIDSIGGMPICNLQEVMPKNGKGEYIVRVKEEF